MTQLVRGNGTVIVASNTAAVLHCFEPKTFWLSWAGGHVQLAQEGEDGPRIIDFLDVAPQQVHYVALSSDGKARWMFPREIGNVPLNLMI